MFFFLICRSSTSHLTKHLMGDGSYLRKRTIQVSLFLWISELFVLIFCVTFIFHSVAWTVHVIGCYFVIVISSDSFVTC